MEIINLGKADGLPPVQWDGIVDKLDAGSAPAPDGMNARTTWLATVNEDGSPHVTAVGAVWLDGTFWFQTGTGTRKGPQCGSRPAVFGRGVDSRCRCGVRGRRDAGDRPCRPSARRQGLGRSGLEA